MTDWLITTVLVTLALYGCAVVVKRLNEAGKLEGNKRWLVYAVVIFVLIGVAQWRVVAAYFMPST